MWIDPEPPVVRITTTTAGTSNAPTAYRVDTGEPVLVGPALVPIADPSTPAPIDWSAVQSSAEKFRRALVKMREQERDVRAMSTYTFYGGMIGWPSQSEDLPASQAPHRAKRTSARAPAPEPIAPLANRRIVILLDEG